MIRVYTFTSGKLILSLSTSENGKTQFVKKSGIHFEFKMFDNLEQGKAYFIEEIGRLL